MFIKWRPHVYVSAKGNIVVRPIESLTPWTGNKSYNTDDSWVYEVSTRSEEGVYLSQTEQIRALRHPTTKAELKDAVDACQRWCYEKNKRQKEKKSFVRDARLKAYVEKQEVKKEYRVERWFTPSERKELNGGP